MGVLVDGEWRVDGEFPKDASGRFVRPDAAFRDWVTADGSAGPTGEGGFAAEAGRYHLYVSLACPWAHRTLIFRKLKGLEAMIGLSVVNWHLGDEGWTFAPGRGVVPDPVRGARRLYELYTASRPRYTGRVSVPVLFDKARGRIVSNESADIIRMFNSAFDGLGAAPGDYYPAELRAEIDALNARIYATRQQRRLSRRLRRQAGRLRRGGARAVRNARRAGGAARGEAFPLRRSAHRGGLAVVPDAGALRPGLCRAVQVQYPAHRRLSPSHAIPARTARPAGDRGDDRSLPHQAALLRQPSLHQSHGNRAFGARRAQMKPAANWQSRLRF